MKSLFLISTVLLVLHEVGGFKPFEISEQGRTVPAWTEYLYFENVGTDTVRREYVLQESDQRTYLLCPKGKVLINKKGKSRYPMEPLFNLRISP